MMNLIVVVCVCEDEAERNLFMQQTCCCHFGLNGRASLIGRRLLLVV